jgi:hypothetical protein
MIWLAWRQHRVSLLAGLGAIAALALFLVLTGLSTRSDFTALGLDSCGVPSHLQCAEASAQFMQKHRTYQFLAPLFLLFPALVGVFWGAPLVSRELEQGTHRLVWTQSISRTRWLATKACFLALLVLAASAAVTALVNWWLDPIMRAEPQQFEPGFFDLLGIVPAAYALTALAIGIAAGTFTRKLVPAIALTLVLFLALRVGVGVGLRPNYMAPERGTFPFPMLSATRDEPVVPAGWSTSLMTLDMNGRFIGDGVGIEPAGLEADCPEVGANRRGAEADGDGPRKVPAEGMNLIEDCARRFGFHVEAVYQPADRYWRFQITEAAIYGLVSAGLIGASAWWIRRRIT